MNPGFAYVAVAWQFAAEVIVPLNRDGGSSTGFRALLNVLPRRPTYPSLFDKPLLSDKPERDQLRGIEACAGTDQFLCRRGLCCSAPAR